jgi:hypothetical protein
MVLKRIVEIAREIYLNTEKYAKSRGVRLDPELEDYIKAHAERAAKEIASRKDLAREEKNISLNFRRLIDGTIEEERAGSQGKRPSVIRITAVPRALEKLCPLFPFC